MTKARKIYLERLNKIGKSAERMLEISNASNDCELGDIADDLKWYVIEKQNA